MKRALIFLGMVAFCVGFWVLVVVATATVLEWLR